jgi:hypothetical protein
MRNPFGRCVPPDIPSWNPLTQERSRRALNRSSIAYAGTRLTLFANTVFICSEDLVSSVLGRSAAIGERFRGLDGKWNGYSVLRFPHDGDGIKAVKARRPRSSLGDILVVRLVPRLLAPGENTLVMSEGVFAANYFFGGG